MWRGHTGLAPADDKWLSGKNMAGVWFETIEDSAMHQAAMDLVPFGQFKAMAVSPLTRQARTAGHLPHLRDARQMIILIKPQWSGYKKFEWSVVGDLRVPIPGPRAQDGELSLAIPCFAERRYGGVLDDELLDGPPAGSSCPVRSPHEAVGRQRPTLPYSPVRDSVRCAAGLAVSYGNRCKGGPRLGVANVVAKGKTAPDSNRRFGQGPAVTGSQAGGTAARRQGPPA